MKTLESVESLKELLFDALNRGNRLGMDCLSDRELEAILSFKRAPVLPQPAWYRFVLWTFTVGWGFAAACLALSCFLGLLETAHLVYSWKWGERHYIVGFVLFSLSAFGWRHKKELEIERLAAGHREVRSLARLVSKLPHRDTP